MINSWDKLTVGKYQEIKEIINNSTDEYEMRTEILSILTDIDVEDLLELPIGRYNHLLQNMNFLLEERRPKMVNTKYVLEGQTFEVMLNVEKMTAAQFIDYQNYAKDVDKNLINILTVFLIPKGHKYNEGYDITEVARIIKDNMSVNDAAALSAFFLECYKALLTTTVRYLTRKMKRLAKKEKNKEVVEKMMEAIAHLEKSGNGLVSLTE